MNTKLLKTATALFRLSILTLDHATRSAGAAWYPRQATRVFEIARRHGAPEDDRTLAAFAALSPRNSVRSNELALDKLLSGRGNPHTANQTNKARLALEIGHAALRGDKETSFALALDGSHDAVTLDLWMSRIVGVTVHQLRHSYPTVALALTEAAAIHDLSPRDTQAALWIQARGAA